MPTTLRVVLLENLRRMADDIARSKVAREVAHAVWDSEKTLDETDLDRIHSLMKERGLARSYLTQPWQRMPTELLSNAPAISQVDWVDLIEPVSLSLSADAVERTAGYYLMGNGRSQLETALGLPAKRALQRVNWHKWRLTIYIAIVTVPNGTDGRPCWLFC